MGLLITPVGHEACMAAIDVFGIKVAVAASEAAYLEALHELALTQELVPVHTGALKRTGHVERHGMDAQASIVYGDSLVDYAVIVHEDLYAYHAHGQAKYVETVVDEEFGSGRAQGRMAETITSLSRL